MSVQVGKRDSEGGAVVDQRAAAARELQSSMRTYPRTRRVLHADDTAANRRLTRELLQHRPSIELIPSARGAIAAQLARETQPDLILLDLQVEDGEGVLADLGAHPATRDIPVVVFTSDTSAPWRERLLAAGVRGCLTKPIEHAPLLSLLDELLAHE